MSALQAGLLAGTALTGAALSGLLLTGSAAHAVELPKGGSVAYGGVAISSPNAGALSIQQSTPAAIVNWQSFSIGQGGRVDVAQPSSASTLLSRVTGSTPSTIAGQLNANGQVYLVNPNGIAITRTGTVNAGGFVASTLDIADDDFVAGRRSFTGRGASAPVVNEGRITIAPGGYAALLGGSVDQAGTISVPMGKVGLGAGERATLDFSGDGFLQVAVPSAPDGSGSALIRHAGRTSAAGGRVEIQAATAREAARSAINLSGIVEARSVGGRSGAIVLGGGAGGGVTVSGRLDVSARSGGSRTRAASRATASDGGSIAVTGDAVRLVGARLDAGGRNGGRIRIGGDVQGGGSLQTASTTGVDAATTIRADAQGAGQGSGQGGSVVIWSQDRTDFAGLISARGGAQGGDGGFAEVSGKRLLAYEGLADLSAARGRYGTLLLDPFNVFITNGADAGATNGGGTFTPGQNDSVVNATTLQTALNAANVTVTTGGAGSPGAQAGDITVAANVAWTAPTTLTLSAFRNIAVSDGITSADINVPAGGGLNLRADNSGTGVGTVTFAAATGVGSVTAAAGSTVNIFYNPASNPAGSGVNATSYLAPTNYAANVAGGTLTAFALVNTPADLQNMRNNLAGNYALGRNVDAAPAVAFNAGAGFAPVGVAAAFTGQFDGLGQTISNLTINNAGVGTGTGLFGTTNGATIRNLALAGAAITGGDNTGGLVGIATGGAIAGVSVSGTVTGGNPTGGLVGGMNGTAISGTSSSATVTGGDNTGGLVGTLEGGSVTTSFATGPVSGGNQVGGLIGIAQDTTLIQLYATGRVTGTGDLVGGLIGGFGGDGPAPAPATLTQSYANGAVTGAGRAGGLVGLVSNDATVSDSYATGLVSGGTASGGLIGQLNTTPVGGAVPPASNPSTITNTYATGLVIGAGVRGGLIGTLTDVNQTVTNSYWDTQTTGQAASAGGLGLGQTTAQLQGALPAGFGGAVWGRQAADTYPYLNWRFPNGILAPSGFVRDAAGAAVAGEPVRLAAGGGASYGANSGANGYYYVARDPLAGAQPQGATVYLDGANRGSSTTDAPTGAGAIANLDVQVGRALVRTAQPNSSGLAAVLASAGDSALSGNIPYTVGATGGVPTFAPGVSLAVEATNPAGLTIDRSLVAAGALQIANAGSFTPAGPITIAPGNTVQSTGGNVVIATSQFTNNAGANAVQAAGRYLIYSNDYAADTRGGLAGANLYNRSFATSPAATIPGAASTFVFTRQPVLTFGAADGTRQYGTAPAAPAGTVTGFVNGDTAAVSYTGAPTLTDTTGAATGVGTYPGAIQVTPGSLASTIGYAFAFTNAAVSITPAPLTVKANDAAKVYGNTLAFAGTEFTTTGLRNADTVTSATLASAGAPATAGVAGSPYAILASNVGGTGLANYAITYAPGALTVTPASLTVRANDLTRTAGGAFVFAGTEFTATGLRNADGVTSATLTSAGASADATAAGSPYAIFASNALGAGLGNYMISYLPGQFTLTQGQTPPVVTPTTPTAPASRLTLALLGDTLSRQLPNFSLPIYNPPDVIQVAANDGGPTIAAATDALASIESASTDLDAGVAACEQTSQRRLRVYTDCVGTALDRYADALESRGLQLPAPLRNVTGVIREAARRVRAARTIAEARTAVRVAVVAVRKAITLIRADDPNVARLQVRQGNAIASALRSVETRLSRAVGL